MLNIVEDKKLLEEAWDKYSLYNFDVNDEQFPVDYIVHIKAYLRGLMPQNKNYDNSDLLEEEICIITKYLNKSDSLEDFLSRF